MIHYTFSTGFSLERESRLCRQLLPKENPLETIGRKLDGADEALGKFYSNAAEHLLNPKKETEVAMSDYREWSQAFMTPRMFEGKPPPNQKEAAVTHSLPDHAFRPTDFLFSRKLAERKVHFFRFLHETIPQNVRETNALLKTIPCLKDKDFEQYLLTHREDGVVAEFDGMAAGSLRTLQEAQAIIYGAGLYGKKKGDDAFEIAKQSFDKIYPVTGEIGHLFQDYVDAVSMLKKKKPEPTDLDLRDPTYFIAKLPTGRLRGLLMVLPNDQAAARLKFMAEKYAQQERDQKLEHIQSRSDMQQIDKQTRLTMERSGRSLMDNYARMEPWQQYVVAGLFVYAMYKMWNSKGKLLWVIPYKWIPPALIGTYLYMRLVKGNDNALNDMMRTGQKYTDKAVNGVFNNPLSQRIFGKPQEDIDLQRLGKMHMFFNKLAFRKIYPSSVAFTTLAEMKLKYLSSQLKPSKDGTGWEFNEDKNSQFDKQITIICKARGYDEAKARQFIYGKNKDGSVNLEHRKQVSGAVASFFFVLGSRKPKNRLLAGKIEQERRSKATATNITPSYESITTPGLQTAYKDIVNDGILMGGGDFANYNLGDLIGELMKIDDQAKERKIDDAQPYEKNGLDFAHRANEKNLYAHSKTGFADTLDKERDALKKAPGALIKKEYDEFVNNCVKHHKLLDVEGGIELTRRLDLILSKDEDIAVILRAVEQLKYAMLVAAYGRGNLPITKGDIITMRISNDPSKPAEGVLAWARNFLDNATNYVNRKVLTVSGKFYTIKDLSSVEIMVKQGIIPVNGVSTLDNRGLPLLTDAVKRYKDKFKAMKGVSGRKTAAKKMKKVFHTVPVNPGTRAFEIKKATVEKDDVTAVLAGADGKGTDHDARIDKMEEYFAQKFANLVLIAALTKHRSNGEHELTLEPDDRLVTPTEERNLVEHELPAIFAAITGDEFAPENPAAGFYGRVITADLLKQVEDVKSAADLKARDVTKPAEAVQSLEDAALLCRAFLYLQSGDVKPNFKVDDIDTMRDQVESIAHSFSNAWFTNLKPFRESNLQPLEAYRNMEVLLRVMKIMRVGEKEPKPKIVGQPSPPAAKPKTNLIEQIEQIVKKDA